MNGHVPNGQPIRLDAGDWVLDGALRQEDVQVIAGWLADRTVARVLGRAAAVPDLQQAVAFMKGFDRVASHLLIARRRTDGMAEGMVIVRMDGRHLVTDLDIIVGARTTRTRDGQKLLLAAGRAVTRWTFEVVGMQKVSARVLDRNRRTAAWASRFMVMEGRLRQHARLPDGSRHDVLQFGLLRDEWAQREQDILSGNLTLNMDKAQSHA